MFKRITQRFTYFGLAAAFLVLCTSLILMYPEGNSFFIFNGLYTGFLDSVFKYATYIGDGMTAAAICILLLVFYNIGSGLLSGMGLAVCGVVSYIFKYHVYIDSDRPKHFFWTKQHLIHFVDGVQINTENSFPSGHTLKAFFIFTFVVMLSFSRPFMWQLFLVFLAVITAYSRVYLAQHFLGDIVSGACFGLVLALLFYKLYTRSKDMAAFNKSLLDLLKK